MRIGIITGEYPPMQGGIGAYTDILSKRLQQNVHDVFIFSQRGSVVQQSKIALKNEVSNWSINTQFAIKNWVENYQLDIVNLQFQTAAFDMSPWIHFLPHIIKTPFVTTFHDLRFPYLFPKAGKLRDWIVMHLANTSEGVIVTNHEDYVFVEHLCAKMIPIGSNILNEKPYQSANLRQKHGIDNADFILAFFGFINHSKGVDTLLYALKQLNNVSIKLLLIGGRTGASDPTNITYADEIDGLINELKLEEQVIWTGYVSEDEVSNYLQLADVVILPFRDGASFRRGSLMAAIEHSCAIITTQPRITIPEFNPENMFLIPPESPEDLVHTIAELKQSPEKRQQLRQNVEVLKRHFDWDTITQETIQFFEQVIGANK